MNRHGVILKLRIQAEAICDGRDDLIDRQHLERAGEKRIQEQEENLDAGHDSDYVRHHLAQFAAIRKDDDSAIRRKNPAPEKQRTFLAAPPRGELIEAGHVAVGVAGDISETEIAGEERIDQDARGSTYQEPHGKDRAAAAQHQIRPAFEFADHAREDSVNRNAKREQYR